jgi:hypothetical protein
MQRLAVDTFFSHSRRESLSVGFLRFTGAILKAYWAVSDARIVYAFKE